LVGIKIGIGRLVGIGRGRGRGRRRLVGIGRRRLVGIGRGRLVGIGRGRGRGRYAGIGIKVIRYGIKKRAGDSKIQKASRKATFPIVDIKISIYVIDFLDWEKS
jgi:hypothetical protein